VPAYKINRIQLIVIVIAVAITLFGAFWYYRYESARISQEKYEDLHAFASLKIEQILNWKSERLTDAASLADNDLFTDMLDSWIREPDQQEKNYLDQLLRLEMERGYYNVLVYDESGNLLTSAKQDPDPLDDAVAVSFSRAASGGKPVLSDAYICPNGIVHLDAVAPVYGREGELVALVVMRSDAHSLLFPLLDSWPTPSDSAETLLARRDGEYALVINEARYAEEGPLSMRKPLSDTSNPAVQAVTGKEGRFEGFDYRGVKVMADLRPVAGTSWFMVTKIDRSELMGELYYRARAIMIFVALFILLATGIIVTIFRQRRLSHLEEMYELEKEKTLALEEYRTTLYSIGDAVITTDREGRVRQMNPVAEQLTGWTETEAAGCQIEEVFNIVSEQSGEPVQSPVRRVIEEGKITGLANHTLLISRSGEKHPIADSGAPLLGPYGAVSGVVLVFRDQAEERQARKRLETANRLYSFLSSINQAVVRKKELKQLFDEICRIAVEAGGFRMAWVGWLDSRNGEVKPLSWYGHEEGFFERVKISIKADESLLTNSARAIREGKIVICDDVSSLEIAPVFKGELLERGYYSIAAIPLEAGGEFKGNFTMYSSAPGFFTGQERRLLEEIGADINYAVDAIEREKKRREAEEKISQNERQMSTLISNLPGAVYRCSADEAWTMHYISAEIEAITGYRPEEICGNAEISYNEITHPDDRSMIQSEIQAALASGLPWEFTYRVVKPSGEIRWVWERGRGVRDKDSNLLFLEGFITDITESKLAGQALAESEERFRSMVNSMEDTVFTLDTETRNTGVYGPWVEKTGASPEDFIGKTARDLFGPEGASVHEEASRKALAGESVIYHWEAPGENGTHYFQTSLSPIRDEGGNITGLVGIGRDITALKKAETALAEEIKRRSYLFEQTPVGIVIVDAESKRFLEFNRIAHENLGYTRDEFRKLSIGDIVPGKIIGETLERIAFVIKGERADFETMQLAKDGSFRNMLVTMQAIEIGGRLLLQTIWQDITERKRMEAEQQELRNKAEISARLATVGEMAAGIAHEINNPLTGVIGFSELLNQEELPPESREYVKYIHEGSNRVKDIVRRLLTFARQEKPFKTRLDIHTLIDNTLELRSYVLATASIEVIKDYQPDLPWVSVDAGQIQQVFLNLIVNAEYAMKKTGGGGTLTVTTRTRGEDVLIVFSDTGQGMDEATLSRLFQPFFTTKEPGEGTGLGLALSRSIIFDHNGDIAVESSPGKGAAFTVSLPQSRDIQPDESSISNKTSSAHMMPGRRILVVDDEPSIRLLVKKALSSSGYLIEEADTAAGALENIKQSTGYDLIIADIRMPGMSGRGLYNNIKKNYPDLAGRVIFITGDISDITTQRFLSSNRVPFISKPFNRGMLLDKIEEVIRKENND